MTANQIIFEHLQQEFLSEQISRDNFVCFGYKVLIEDTWASFQCNDLDGKRWEYSDSYNQYASFELVQGQEHSFIKSIQYLTHYFKEKRETHNKM